jgi:hypothetical protein
MALAFCLATAVAAVDAQGGARSTTTTCERPGRVVEVGPGKAFATPSAAAAVARTGDVVLISAGDYRGDVASWTASRLTICSAGGRVRLFADGRSAQAKALWVIAGSDVEIDGIEFHGVKVPDRNGAGIRAEHDGRLIIRNSGFFDNENGILGGHPGATISIERSEFARNGYGDGYSHNLYGGDIDRLTVVGSFFHQCQGGPQLQEPGQGDRDREQLLHGRAAGTSSYLADRRPT